MLDDKIPPIYLCSQLKDETLKLEKIYAAKTRTFEVFPGPMALIFRKYFGAFIAANQKVCTEKPISVGINAHSIQWQQLYNRLNRFGGDVIAGDYKAWDKRLSAQAIWRAVQVINTWYGDSAENQKVRELLGYLMIHAYMLLGNEVYEKDQGLPSGVPVTGPLNSVANALYLFSAILTILEEDGVQMTDKEIIEGVEMALYGDDHVVALNAKLRKHVTFKRVQAFFANIGVVYTDAQKTDRSEFEFEKLTDITYLKRKFAPQNGFVFAPLDKDSVEDQLNWVKDSKEKTHFDSLAECFDSFRIESMLHGETYFTEMHRKLLHACTGLVGFGRLPAMCTGRFSDYWPSYLEAYAVV